MPYKSKAQARLFFAKERAGELPEGTAREWAQHTPDIKKLPEHVEAAGGSNMKKRADPVGQQDLVGLQDASLLGYGLAAPIAGALGGGMYGLNRGVAAALGGSPRPMAAIGQGVGHEAYRGGGIGLGAGLGATAGGMLGNHLSGGNPIATLAGAVPAGLLGAYLGNRLTFDPIQDDPYTQVAIKDMRKKESAATIKTPLNMRMTGTTGNASGADWPLHVDVPSQLASVKQPPPPPLTALPASPGTAMGSGVGGSIGDRPSGLMGMLPTLTDRQKVIGTGVGALALGGLGAYTMSRLLAKKRTRKESVLLEAQHPTMLKFAKAVSRLPVDLRCTVVPVSADEQRFKSSADEEYLCSKPAQKAFEIVRRKVASEIVASYLDDLGQRMNAPHVHGHASYVRATQMLPQEIKSAASLLYKNAAATFNMLLKAADTFTINSQGGSGGIGATGSGSASFTGSPAAGMSFMKS